MMEEPTFETERIKELKNERISLQKKTFSKWMNTFLQDNSKVDDLFMDLTDGRVLICLLESISGEKVGRIARGKQRIHKLENVSKALTFLQKSIKLESIGPEDIVDGKQDLILGLIWMIILRFQISKVENEGGSKDARSAKDALLLWCQRKTKGYPGVDIRNFTTSWKNGLAFNALIHKHRPDLMEFSKLQPMQHRSNLNLAFTIAGEQLGVAKLLDPEDFDCPRPDEKSVMTYVSMLYQYFAKMKSEETGGKRIAKILDVTIDIEKMKQKYQDLVRGLLEWITVKIHWLDADVPSQLALLQQSMNDFKALRTVEKPKKYIERANLEELFFIIQTKSNAYRLKPYLPPEGVALSDINVAWQELEKGEHQREIRLRKELARQERLSQLAERYMKKVKLRDSWLDEMLNVVRAEETSKSLQGRDVNVSLKRHEAIETDVKARGIKVESMKAICEELGAEKYEEFPEIHARQKQIEEKWQLLLGRMQKRKLFLVTLNEVSPVISDIEKLSSHLKEAEINLSNEELKKDLGGIDDQIQKHILQESQLTSYKAQIQSVIASSNDLLTRQHPQSRLIHEKVQAITKQFENVAKQSNSKGKTMHESRNLHLFKEAVKKESAFIQDKSQLAASKEVGKDFLSFIRLQKKLQTLVAEIEACKTRCDVVCGRGQQLIVEGNSSAEEVKQLTADLQISLENLKRLAETRKERLNEAAQSFQYYSDANEVESWIDEHMQLVASEDYGKDTETAKSLLQRHQQITEEITAFNDDMLTLQEECKLIEENDNQIEAGLNEVSDRCNFDEVEVETETEDEEVVDKLVEQRVVKEFKVAQVSARCSYSGEGLTMKKGEVFYVAAKTNKDWWNVRRLSSKESGYVPTAYIQEIEPKIFKKPMMEKVIIKEKVKVKRKKLKKVRIEKSAKDKISDNKAKRTSSILRKKGNQHGRKSRFTQHFDRENVTTRHLAIVVAYAKLKAAATEREKKLNDAMAYFEFCSAHDVTMAWIDDQIRYLTRWTAFTDKIDTDTIKKLLERIEHEISANENSYEDVLKKGNTILGNNNGGYTESVREKLDYLQSSYNELLNLKASRQNDLIKGHGIEMFLKSCTELIAWISTKSKQLDDVPVGTNQEKIRALQRRHQNFEHELEAIGDRVRQLRADSKKASKILLENTQRFYSLRKATNRAFLLENIRFEKRADNRKDMKLSENFSSVLNDIIPFNSLRHVHPSVSKDVEKKENEVEMCWKALQGKAASRKLLLQDAYGLQEFLDDHRDIVNWAKDVRNRFVQSDLPRDLAVIEDVIREHNEARLEMKGNVQRLTDVIESGEGLKEKSSAPENFDSLISELKMYQMKVPESWENRKTQLSLCKNTLIFCRDADSFVSKAAVIQKLLSTNDRGASLENVTTLLKQVEGLSQKVFQQEERFKKLVVSADETLKANPNEASLISTKKDEVVRSHDMTEKLLKERKDVLKQSKEFHQFHADIEEFISWINDKLALVSDDSYKDLTSLQSKVLKHQALQAEVISNEGTKNRLLQAGDELLSEHNLASDEIEHLMTSLNESWERLQSDVKLKQDKLEQATQARAFSSASDDFTIWCDQIQNVLASQELGDDLSSVKFLLAKHQASENEIAQHQEDLEMLEQEANCMLEHGNFRTENVRQNLNQIQQRMGEISDAAKVRRMALDDSYLLQQFLFEVNVQLSWTDEHLAQINNAEAGSNLTTAKRLLNRHEAIQNELNSHAHVIDKLVQNGIELARTCPLHADVTKIAFEKLKDRFGILQKASYARKDVLQQNCNAFQFIVDANEMESWLDEKAALASGLQQSKDLDSTERQLKKSTVLIDDLKHIKHSIELLKKRAKEMENDSNPKMDEIFYRCENVIDKEQKLTAQLQRVHENLEYLRKVYQFFYDAENLRDLVSEKLKVASAEGYGKDLEHWQAISQKFDDFKVSIAAGRTAYIAVIGLADEIIACRGPHTNNVSKAKDKLSTMWNRLMEKVKQKNSRLLKAGELHKFNLQVSDIVANLKEKENKINVNDLGDDVISTESKVRAHDAAMNELEAVSKQISSAEDAAKKLMANYPGKTAEQIQMHQSYVKKFYSDILRKAKNIKGKLHGSVDYHRLNSEIGNLLSWCLETADAIGSREDLEDVNEIEEAMDKIDDLKLEIDGKEEKFGFVVEAGEQMVEEGHHATEEIQEKLEELITCREDLHNTWLQRKKYLTESYDFAMFSREMSRISMTINSNKTILNSVAGGPSKPDIESMSKRVQNVKTMLESQASKLDAVLDLGSQLINDGHFASSQVAGLIEEVTRNRDSLKTVVREREEFLQSALSLADFRMQNEEIQSWIAEKLSNVESRQIDISNIGMYSTIHKSDIVEFEARNAAKEGLRSLGEKLIEAKHYASSEIEGSVLETCRLFDKLDKKNLEAGKSIEQMKNIAELKRDCNFAEAHITEKERSLATDEVGGDYDKCQILRKHLETTTNHMKADEERINSINRKAKFLSAIDSEAADELAMHLRMLNSRWENLKDLVSSRRNVLDKAVKLHLFRKNTEETSLRIKEKTSLLANSYVASDLNGVQKQIRRHALLESDVEAIEKSLEDLDIDAREIVKDSPENLAEIQGMQTSIIEMWETLVELMDDRQSNLQAAEHLYRFETDVSSLSSWMQKARERLANITESRNVKETKAMLDMYNQIKSELNIREEVYDRVQKYGEALVTEGGLQPDEVYPKLQLLDKEKEELEALLREKNFNLKHSFDIQRLGSELEQMRIWLDRRNDILLDDNYGNSLEEVEKLIVHHDDMRNTIDKFHDNIASLKSFVDQIKANGSQNSVRMREKYEEIKSRLNSANTTVDSKLKKLHESQLFFKFLMQTTHVIEWIDEKLKYARSEPETTTSLQNCKKVYDAVEAEMTANSKNMKDCISDAQALIEQSIRAESVNFHMNSLLESWDELKTALKKKGEQLQERFVLDKIENAFGGIVKWLERTEHSLSKNDFGKDLNSVVSLQAKQKEIANEAIEKEGVMKEVEGLLDNRVKVYTSQRDEMRGRFDDICERLKDLVLTSERRRAELEYSSEFHLLNQEIEDEKLWIKEKSVYLESQEFGSDLTSAKHVFKRHQILESEIASHEEIVTSLLKKLADVPNDSIFKEELSDARERLDKDWQSLRKLAREKSQKTREFVYFLKLTTDISQALMWLKDHLPVLQDDNYGKDESTATTMLRKTTGLLNDVTAFNKTIQELNLRVQNMIGGNFCGQSQRDAAKKLQETLCREFQSALHLGNLRSRKLNESIREHRFSRITGSITFWIEEKKHFVYSNENGQGPAQTENILKTFQEFLLEFKSIETSVQESSEMVTELEKYDHSNVENIRSIFADMQSRFIALRQASLDRLRRLENAKKIHIFKQTIDELGQWIETKFCKIISVDLKSGLQSLADLRKKHEAFMLDLNALTSKVSLMHESFGALSEQIPEAVDSLQATVDQIDSNMKKLVQKSSDASAELVKAEQFKSFCQATEDLKLWIKDRISIVKGNVQSLLSKSVDHENAYITYRDHLTERDALQSRIDNLFQEAGKLVEAIPDVSSIINEEIQSLSQDWRSFENELKSFHEDLDDTKDSEALKDDLVNIEEWIAANDGTFGDFEGSSLDEIEEMLRLQDDFEKSIAVQEGRFQSTLGKLSKYTEKVENKYTKRKSQGEKFMLAENISDTDNQISAGIEPMPGSEMEVKANRDGKLQQLQLHHSRENRNATGKTVPTHEVDTRKQTTLGKSTFQDGMRNQRSGVIAKQENLTDSNITSSSDETSPRSIEETLHHKLARDRTLPSSVPNTIPTNMGAKIGMLRKEEVDPSQKKNSEMTSSSLETEQVPLLEQMSRDMNSMKGEIYPDKLIPNKKPLVDYEATAKVAISDNGAKGTSELSGDGMVDKAIISYADSIGDATLPDVCSDDNNLHSHMTNRSIGRESRQSGTTVGSPEAQPVVISNEIIVPEQVPTAESAIDFEFFYEDDLDDEDDISFDIEVPVEETDSTFRPISTEMEDLKFPDMQGKQTIEERNTDEKAGRENQSIWGLDSSRTDTGDYFTSARDDRFWDDIGADTSSKEKSVHQENDSTLESKTTRNDWNETSGSAKARLEDASSTKLDFLQQKDEVSSSEGSSRKAKSKPIPAIFLSRPSNTEDDFKQQLNQNAPVYDAVGFAGNLEFKDETVHKGRKSLSNKWMGLYAVIEGNLLISYDTEVSFKKSKAPMKELDLEDSMVSVEPGIMNNTLRLVLANKSEFLVRSSDAGVFDQFLMAVSECARMTSREDTISLPPAPPPPTMPQDDGEGDKVATAQVQLDNETKEPLIPPPELSSDESDEFDDVLPPPAPVRSYRAFPNLTERRVSLGLLELVGRSSALADNSSDDDESRSSSTFDADILEVNKDKQSEEKPPTRVSNMNKLFSKLEPAFADETTPITPFGGSMDQTGILDEVTTGDLSGFLGPTPKTNQSTNENPRNPVQGIQRPTNLNLLSSSSGFAKSSFDKSPSPSQGKEQKKKGFLGGIFKKKK